MFCEHSEVKCLSGKIEVTLIVHETQVEKMDVRVQGTQLDNKSTLCKKRRGSPDLLRHTKVGTRLGQKSSPKLLLHLSSIHMHFKGINVTYNTDGEISFISNYTTKG